MLIDSIGTAPPVWASADRRMSLISEVHVTLSRREESNLRPTVYETVALPLSYAGDTIGIIVGVMRGFNRGNYGRFGDRRLAF